MKVLCPAYWGTQKWSITRAADGRFGRQICVRMHISPAPRPPATRDMSILMHSAGRVPKKVGEGDGKGDGDGGGSSPKMF